MYSMDMSVYFNCRWTINFIPIHKKFDIFDSDINKGIDGDKDSEWKRERGKLEPTIMYKIGINYGSSNGYRSMEPKFIAFNLIFIPAGINNKKVNHTNRNENELFYQFKHIPMIHVFKSDRIEIIERNFLRRMKV